MEMNLKDFDLFHLSKLTSHQVDHVTCLECCKYYIAPETATCGHTLCHTCWRGRRTCPSCAAPLEKKSLKLNLQIQHLTEHIHALGDAFEKLFNIKLDEFELDGTSHEIKYDSDPTKNVKEWLASSQNQFSAPIINSEPFSQEFSPIELSSSKIQIHMSSKKSTSPQKVVYVPPPQDDWDKIEQLPETDDMCANNKENLTNQTNKQPYLIGDEYTTDNPRRSSRKRDYITPSETVSKNQEIIAGKPSSKNSSSVTEKKSNKAKQNWSNVKRMRKEFSKLNQKNRSKLNVSIEMCRKTQSATKANIDLDQFKLANQESQPATYTIEDNTPDINMNNNMEQLQSYSSHPIDKMTSENKQNNTENHVEMTSEVVATDLNNTTIKEKHVKQDSVLDQNRKTNVSGKALSRSNESEKVQSNKNDSINAKVPFIKKTGFCSNCSEKNNNLEDIEITFKVGNTLTNITIKRKNNDVQLKVKADQEVQTSLGSNCLTIKNKSDVVKNINPQEIQINIGNNNAVSTTQIENTNIKVNSEYDTAINKTRSTKKNTASADTATAPFEITESVEKELSNVMECAETEDMENRDKVNNRESSNILKSVNVDKNREDYIHDLDIFDNESVQEPNIQLLNKSKLAPSEILMPTVKTKSQKHPDKRDREKNDDDYVPNAKKIKTTLGDTKGVEKNLISDITLQSCPKDSESINYDDVMGQVFASIDADIEKSQKSSKIVQDYNAATSNNGKVTMKSQYTDKVFESQRHQVSTQKSKIPNIKDTCNEKYSENIFSIVEKEEEFIELAKKGHGEDGSTQRHIENLLTPGMCQDLISTHEGNIELINKEQCTPFDDHDDSDKSVVEETPQKNVSFPKPKNISDANIDRQQRANSGGVSKVASSSQLVKSIINVSDTLVNTTKTSKDHMGSEPVLKKTLETPLTINKFVDHIKHKSTPVARKSLNFDTENTDDVDPEQTLCPSSVVAKTTQEKEFMTKAFEESPKSPIKKPLMTRNAKVADLKYCIAGSCLSAAEVTNLKYLCRKYDWKYVDKYTKELTHLVVGVDEENRSQRSVKYMCALAASKWIVSYEWVDACISTNLVVGESLYEALDGTGEPGPKRSRLAKAKLFEGITFYCMPPFSVLDVDTLKEMLEAAGGRVVDEVKAVRAAAAPALLLAEPEHTQEDRFVYLALELNIVPVNYEWVLNCLGAYALSSVRELLMCPAALLPPDTAKWPDVLMARDSY